MPTEPEPITAEIVDEEETAALTVAQPAALVSIERAQKDAMIQFAIDHPRPSLQTIAQQVMRELDQETAAECFYTLQRKNRSTGETKLIQGPSIRLAELVRTRFRHTSAGARVISNDGRQIVSQGWCYDAENNNFESVEEARSILTSSGRPFSADMQIMTGRANNAIAKRNAILALIPRTLTNMLYEYARKKAVGDAKSLDQKRQSVFGRFAQMGVKREQILTALGKQSIEEVDAEALEILIGIGTAIKEGMVTIDEAFGDHPQEAGEAAPEPKLSLRDLASKGMEARARREKR